MAHINYFGVENFKVFGKFTEFNFRPITILTGANGSGKSALTKAMQLAGQAFGGYSLSQELDFSRNPLLGNYQTTISGKDVECVDIQM